MHSAEGCARGVSPSRRRTHGPKADRVRSRNPPAICSTRNADPDSSCNRLSSRMRTRARVPSGRRASFARRLVESGSRARKRAASRRASSSERGCSPGPAGCSVDRATAPARRCQRERWRKRRDSSPAGGFQPRSRLWPPPQPNCSRSRPREGFLRRMAKRGRRWPGGEGNQSTKTVARRGSTAVHLPCARSGGLEGRPLPPCRDLLQQRGPSGVGIMSRGLEDPLQLASHIHRYTA